MKGLHIGMHARADSDTDDRTLRPATDADVPALVELIGVSSRVLGVRSYTPEQIEGALAGAFGVDTQLIADGTYFVIERAGALVACGGWSRRATLYGSDALATRDARLLDPATEAARIRAFYVHPDCARSGLGARLIARCEREAASAGFRTLELLATLSGLEFYTKHGYRAGAEVVLPVPTGPPMRFVPMRKELMS